MPSSSLLPSVIGNVVAARQRLSSVRQRVGLEPSDKAMSAATPAQGAPAAAPDQGFDPMGHELHPDAQSGMLQKVQGFIDQYGQQQQDMIDQSGQDGGQGQVIEDQATLRALAPMADFFKENGRLPSPDELKSMAASNQLSQTLGRKPSDTEVSLWMEKPPRLNGGR